KLVIASGAGDLLRLISAAGRAQENADARSHGLRVTHGSRNSQLLGGEGQGENRKHPPTKRTRAHSFIHKSSPEAKATPIECRVASPCETNMRMGALKAFLGYLKVSNMLLTYWDQR